MFSDQIPLQADKERQLNSLVLELMAHATAQDHPSTPVGTACDGQPGYIVFPTLTAPPRVVKPCGRIPSSV